MDKRKLLIVILFSLLSFNLSAKYDKWNDKIINEQQENSDSVITIVESRQKICKTHYNLLNDTDKLRYIQIDDEDCCKSCQDHLNKFCKPQVFVVIIFLIILLILIL